MGLFSEMKMRCDRVLSQVHGEIANENERGSYGSTARERLGQQFDDRHRQHESRAKCEEVFDNLQLQHRPSRYGEPAKNVPKRCNQSKEESLRHGRVSTPEYFA